MSTGLIVVGGGEGLRLGRLSKPELRIGGRRLLDIVLDAAAGCTPRVAVVPEPVPVPDGVLRTIEDPPLGGPVAGISAGLRAIDAAGTAPEDVLVLACDLPGAGELARLLLEGRRSQLGPTAGDDATADGLVIVHPDGRREMLAFVAARRALEASVEEGGSRDRSVRSLLEPLHLDEVGASATAVEDVDTWDHHARWESRS